MVIGGFNKGLHLPLMFLGNLAEITDKGRQTTLDLGRRLRKLYVDQLGFLPSTINDPSTVYLRASPYPRALDSLLQAFSGLYPSDTRAATYSSPTIVTRTLAEETILPNEDHCQRLIQLIQAFSRRTAVRCEYITPGFLGTFRR